VTKLKDKERSPSALSQSLNDSRVFSCINKGKTIVELNYPIARSQKLISKKVVT